MRLKTIRFFFFGVCANAEKSIIPLVCVRRDANPPAAKASACACGPNTGHSFLSLVRENPTTRECLTVSGCCCWLL